ncbi:energy transducer TonB [Syntrophotalea acetylenica]|uniref:TonB C-terminal domain-containing protein n=1 Tax=Syntrophotalea acetylenica TaxID=29542 RepID=A0A1L3GGZ8_SYNAC|nr:energy transducer TonB [Syntrophotalea acetylenica]APG25216.1 hypothetical protein A7E75_09410 [Syntrophotalea acetylenica]APG43285.1 hypothetical protein A6070_03385 [Syntrophotalea acetylenica]
MKFSRTWVAMMVSVGVHVGMVLALAIGMITPVRRVNRIEVDLEGVAMPIMPPDVAAPLPAAGPEMPSLASIPTPAAAPRKLPRPAPVVAMPAQAPAPSLPVADGDFPPAEVGALPGPPSVAMTTGVGGGGDGGAGSASGSGGGGAGLAGGGRGRRGGGSGSALAGYLQAIRARVDAAKRYPQMAQQRRQEGTAVVSFRLTPSGELVAEPVVSRSSGYRQLDDAAVRAVSRGAPYPRFPLDPSEMRAIEIPVKFYLR